MSARTFIECEACQHESEQSEATYCEKCFNEERAKVFKLEDIIADLNNRIIDLELEIEKREKNESSN